MKLIYHFTEDQKSCDELAFATPGAAGIDLPAAPNHEAADKRWTIPPLCSEIIDTGIQVAIPEGCFGRVLMRSGHGFKRGLICHVGTIDSDYRGRIKVKVFNLSGDTQFIESGERFAQLIVQQFVTVELVRYNGDLAHLSPTERGGGGFGSTGA